MSQTVLVRFGFLKSEHGFHIGPQKVPIEEQFQCSDFWLTAVLDDSALPPFEQSLKHKNQNCAYPLLWKLVNCMYKRDTSELAQFLKRPEPELIQSSSAEWSEKFAHNLLMG